MLIVLHVFNINNVSMIILDTNTRINKKVTGGYQKTNCMLALVVYHVNIFSSHLV